ncbi:hypothetical protein EV426DRAFT_394479 [Tirmania nivea]|nr:hypothetical protein EV426DRAFT_394479 [Tirmania nivea]
MHLERQAFVHTTLYSMAFIFESQGQYNKALEWYGRALAGYEKSIGSNHPNTQTTIRRLTELHERVGQIEQAQGLRTRLRKIDLLYLEPTGWLIICLTSLSRKRHRSIKLLRKEDIL